MVKSNTIKVSADNLGFCDYGKDIWGIAFGKKKTVDFSLENARKFMKASEVYWKEQGEDGGYGLDTVLENLLDFIEDRYGVDVRELNAFIDDDEKALKSVFEIVPVLERLHK
jgi:hypothetical protein